MQLGVPLPQQQEYVTKGTVRHPKSGKVGITKEEGNITFSRSGLAQYLIDQARQLYPDSITFHFGAACDGKVVVTVIGTELRLCVGWTIHIYIHTTTRHTTQHPHYIHHTTPYHTREVVVVRRLSCCGERSWHEQVMALVSTSCIYIHIYIYAYICITPSCACRLTHLRLAAGVDVTAHKIHFQLAGGSKVSKSYDLCVGADGVGSAVRAALQQYYPDMTVVITDSGREYKTYKNLRGDIEPEGASATLSNKMRLSILGCQGPVLDQGDGGGGWRGQ